MSTSRAGLVDAILNAALDDDLRLVFADFLTDEAARLSGAEGDALQARADLFRTQCHLARLADNDPARPELVAREQELLTTYSSTWAQNLGHPVVGYRRGSADLGELTPPEVEKLPDALFLNEPVEFDLDLRSSRFGSEEVEAALASVDALASRPCLRAARAITTLQSRSMRHPDQGYFARLMRSPHLGNLTSINLFDLIVGPEGILALAGSPSSFRLKELHLHGSFVDSEDEMAEETEEIVEAFTALIQSDKVSTLQTLTLSFNALGKECMKALADDNALPDGLVLEVNEVNIGPGIRSLRPVVQRIQQRFQFEGLR
jgi:uncharacterized protein (TIGR02996 family)